MIELYLSSSVCQGSKQVFDNQTGAGYIQGKYFHQKEHRLPMEDTGISHRKAEHIQIVLNQDVDSSLTTGFEEYAFIHQALPEIDLAEVDTTTVFLRRKLGLPLLISSMTGGTDEARQINRNLAQASQQCRVAMGIGSQRAMLENPELLSSFAVRDLAPDVPILANLGAVQLNYGFGLDECKRAVDLLQADALILHLNPLQEALQPEGNTHWRGLREKIQHVIQHLGCPVIIKEVGWGIATDLARQFVEMGAYAVDVAGAGGTSWSQVEKHRLKDERLRAVADQFRGWGIPTARALVDLHTALPQARIIASGGLQTGIDLCKALALGAHLGGMAGGLLKAAAQSPEAAVQRIRDIQLEMQICMFASGLADLESLNNSDRLQKVH